MPYDPDNIFAKILRGEIPCNKIYEDDFVLAFHDVAPKKKTHILIIPKNAFMDVADFGTNGSDQEIAALIRAVPKVAAMAGVKETGFRLISNCGRDGGQEVPHLHLHLLGGETVGAMVPT